jgi:hypothetical protein
LIIDYKKMGDDRVVIARFALIICLLKNNLANSVDE